jgi:hypothetical protein
MDFFEVVLENEMAISGADSRKGVTSILGLAESLIG